MKKILFVIGGVCAAAAGFLVFGTKRMQPVHVMEYQVEAAWIDHPPVA